MSFRILGTGSAVPQKVVSNEELSAMVDTSDDWIVSRTGISNRRVTTDESMSELCIRSAVLALENARVLPGDLDLILCATIGGDFITPSQACLIQAGIGAHCPAFDINAACSGFVYALDVAESYMKAGKARKVLVVAYDTLSKFVDWNDRNTCVLFGDGGGAVVLGEGDDLLGIHLTSEGNADLINIPCQSESPFDSEPPVKQHLRMNGTEVFKFAVSRIVTEIQALLDSCGLTKEDIDLVLLHQANIRIIQYAQQKLGMEESKFLTNIRQYGNTSAGSIPVLLDELHRQGVLRRGQLLVFMAFGGGLTTGGCILRWNPASAVAAPPSDVGAPPPATM